MPEEKYYIISCGEGDPTIDEFSREELIAYLNDEKEGCQDEFTNTCPKYDMWELGDKSLLIKGRMIIPSIVTTVEKYDVE